MMVWRWLSSVGAMLVFTASGCKVDDGDDSVGGSANNETGGSVAASCADRPIVHVSGAIETDTTWSNDSTYVIDDSVSLSNAKLTIEPGTVIKVAILKDGPMAAPFYVTAAGSIEAIGTASDRIVITSIADDSICGDTDGISSSPKKGDWGAVNVAADVDSSIYSKFAYCDFYYGGAGNYEESALFWAQSNVTVDNCTFAHSAHAGLDVMDASDESDDDTLSTVTNCTFYDNTKPMWMDPSFSLDGSNKFYNRSNPSEVNDYNGIWMRNSSGTAKNRTWGDNGVPYVFAKGYFFLVNEGTTLTVEKGTVVKFYGTGTVSGEGGGVWLGEGASIVNLEAAVFTSYLDDAHGGDTNMDGSATSPADSDWEGIQVYDGSMLSNAGIWYDAY